MPRCSKCATDNADAEVVCRTCGSRLLPATEYFVLRSSTGEVLGPVSEANLIDWIDKKSISSADSISAAGESTWTPILESPFSNHLVDRLRVEQIASSTCPRCGAGMVAIVRSSRAGLWLIIIGVILTPVFCIGTVLWVWGMILMHGSKGKTYLQCPRCKFTTG